jgi:hypothetical protein
MSKLILWETPIQASWVRSMELRSLQYTTSMVAMVVYNDDDGKTWQIRFDSTQGLRITPFECGSKVTRGSQGEGAMFEVVESQWIDDLGRGRVKFLDASRHFVICCYDEVVEVVAHKFDISEVPGDA